MATISIVLKDSPAVIEKKILKGLMSQTNQYFTQVVPKLREKIKTGTFDILTSSGTYQSLLNGDLAGHFGIPEKRRKENLTVIIETIVNNIVIEKKLVRKVGGTLKGAMRIGVVIANFTDILALPQAVIFTEKYEPLEWLTWLLKAGNRMIIKEYDVYFYPGEGRSGMAIMLPEDGGSWRVPPEHSGTMKNNWLTKIVLSSEYQDFITKSVKEFFNN